MPDEYLEHDKQQPLELIPDFSYESRHEFLENLAHKLWVQRGSPIGSPEIDWFAAERMVYASLETSGMITPSSNDQRNIEETIDRWEQTELEG